MDCFCGIDIGASAAKLVILDETGGVVAKAIRRSGVNYAATADACLAEAMEKAKLGRSAVRASMATGYGRDNVPWAGGTRSEIACHGRGAYFHFRKAITVIDIGAQDNKVIHLDDAGRCMRFKMNRKCAAGTGSFLEEIAYRLDLPLADLNGLAARADREVALGSFCTVFAATEVLSRIRAGEPVEAIVRGAFRSVAKRVLEMDAVDGSLVLTGGVVGHNPFLAEMIGQTLGTAANVPPDAQFVGAFGAALLARKTAGTPREANEGA